jgi:Spy/CpxP family protein refolding chaperone
MKKLRPWIVIALVFAAGLIVGAGGTRFAIRKVIERVMNDPSLVQDKIERNLARELKLTPDQRSQVHEIVERSQGELRQLRAEFRPRLGQILRRSEREIRAVLKDAQQEKFDRLLKRKPIVPPDLDGAASPK